MSQLHKSKLSFSKSLLGNMKIFLIGLLLSLSGGQLLETRSFAEGHNTARDYVTLDPKDPDDAEYIERFERLKAATMNGGALQTYDVTRLVPGSENPKRLEIVSDAERSISADALESISQYSASRNSSALIVWRDGKLEYEEYFGNTTWKTPIISRSLAKPLSSLAIGRAIELGAIDSLDQPVADFIPEWEGETFKSEILVRHLLDMRTGFLPQDFILEQNHILNLAYLHPRNDEIILKYYPVIHKPGTRYDYANATAEMVAIVIERATGRSYGDFVSSELLKLMGSPGGKIALNRDDGPAHSGCCIFLTPQSWLKLAILVMKDGVWGGTRLLPEGYAKEMMTGTQQNPHYGLGVYIGTPYDERRGFSNKDIGLQGVLHSEAYLADDLVLFDGNSNQVVYIIPSLDLVVLRTGKAPSKDVSEWDNAFLPNQIIRGLLD
jgi:CubicO group peptidase (beta-lactamase class C family)